MAQTLRVFGEEPSGPPSDEPLYYARCPEDVLDDRSLSRVQRELVTQIMRRVFDGSATSITLTQIELARRVGVHPRTIRRNIKGIEAAGWMSFGRDVTRRGAPWTIEIHFVLRKALRLESDPADGPPPRPTILKASRCKRTESSASNHKPGRCKRTESSGCKRTESSAPLLFEERETEKETTTTAFGSAGAATAAEVPASSFSFPIPPEEGRQEAPGPPPCDPRPEPRPIAPGCASSDPTTLEAVAAACRTWPEMLPGNAEAEVQQLAGTWGEPFNALDDHEPERMVGLAIMYTEALMKNDGVARGWGFVVKMFRYWRDTNRGPELIRPMVKYERDKLQRKREAEAKAAARSAPAIAASQAEPEPSADDPAAGVLEMAEQLRRGEVRLPSLVRMFTARIREAVAAGIVGPEVAEGLGGNEPGAGPACQAAPAPGRSKRVPDAITDALNPTVFTSSRQGESGPARPAPAAF